MSEFKGVARWAAAAVAVMAASAANAVPLSANSAISFAGGGDAPSPFLGSVLAGLPGWTGLDFTNLSGNAMVVQPPLGLGPTGSLSGSTGNATFFDVSFGSGTCSGSCNLFTTSDGFTFQWSAVTSSYTAGAGAYQAYFTGLISKPSSFDATPFVLSLSTQPQGSGEVPGLSWSAQGSVVSLPGTVALIGLGLATVGFVRMRAARR
jgi:hypothetical protein